MRSLLFQNAFCTMCRNTSFHWLYGMGLVRPLLQANLLWHGVLRLRVHALYTCILWCFIGLYRYLTDPRIHSYQIQFFWQKWWMVMALHCIETRYCYVFNNNASSSSSNNNNRNKDHFIIISTVPTKTYGFHIFHNWQLQQVGAVLLLGQFWYTAAENLHRNRKRRTMKIMSFKICRSEMRER
jgi:hypothetical protein